MTEAVIEAADRIDPRVRRTRQLLQEALERLLALKGLEQISVADVTTESTLNRATFYDHYPDKFALLEDLVRERFQKAITQSGVVFDGTCPSALQGIAAATCNYFAALPGIDCPERRHIETHFESAMMAVLRGMLLTGIGRHAPPAGAAPSELTAAVLAGAIYSGAREWVRTPDRSSAQEASAFIFSLVAPMLNRSLTTAQSRPKP